jgi:hypothetical protein
MSGRVLQALERTGIQLKLGHRLKKSMHTQSTPAAAAAAAHSQHGQLQRHHSGKRAHDGAGSSQVSTTWQQHLAAADGRATPTPPQPGATAAVMLHQQHQGQCRTGTTVAAAAAAEVVWKCTLLVGWIWNRSAVAQGTGRRHVQGSCNPVSTVYSAVSPTAVPRRHIAVRVRAAKE